MVPKKYPCIYLLHQKNAKYLSPLYVSKHTETMSNYKKQPLKENMRSNSYSFYKDETSDVTSIEQLAIYATSLRNLFPSISPA